MINRLGYLFVLKTGDTRRFYLDDSEPKDYATLKRFIEMYKKDGLRDKFETVQQKINPKNSISENKTKLLYHTKMISKRELNEKVLREGKEYLLLMVDNKMDAENQIIYGNINLASLIVKKLKIKHLEIVYYDVNVNGESPVFEDDQFMQYPSLFFLPSFSKIKPFLRIKLKQSAGQLLTICQKASDLGESSWPKVRINLDDYLDEKIFDGKAWLPFEEFMKKHFGDKMVKKENPNASKGGSTGEDGLDNNKREYRAMNQDEFTFGGGSLDFDSIPKHNFMDDSSVVDDFHARETGDSKGRPDMENTNLDL